MQRGQQENGNKNRNSIKNVASGACVYMAALKMCQKRRKNTKKNTNKWKQNIEKSSQSLNALVEIPFFMGMP